MNQFVMLTMVGVGLIFGAMVFGLVVQRMIAKVYTRQTSGPRKVPPAHGRDRRPPGSSRSS